MLRLCDSWTPLIRKASFVSCFWSTTFSGDSSHLLWFANQWGLVWHPRELGVWGLSTSSLRCWFTLLTSTSFLLFFLPVVAVELNTVCRSGFIGIFWALLNSWEKQHSVYSTMCYTLVKTVDHWLFVAQDAFLGITGDKLMFFSSLPGLVSHWLGIHLQIVSLNIHSLEEYMYIEIQECAWGSHLSLAQWAGKGAKPNHRIIRRLTLLTVIRKTWTFKRAQNKFVSLFFFYYLI